MDNYFVHECMCTHRTCCYEESALIQSVFVKGYNSILILIWIHVFHVVIMATICVCSAHNLQLGVTHCCIGSVYVRTDVIFVIVPRFNCC